MDPLQSRRQALSLRSRAEEGTFEPEEERGGWGRIEGGREVERVEELSVKRPTVLGHCWRRKCIAFGLGLRKVP